MVVGWLGAGFSEGDGRGVGTGAGERVTADAGAAVIRAVRSKKPGVRMAFSRSAGGSMICCIVGGESSSPAKAGSSPA
jgi:hypothetical protein